MPSLIDVATEFATEEAYLNYLEKMRWPEGVRCLACQSDRVSKFKTKEGKRRRFSKRLGKTVEVKVPSRHLYECLECGCQFSAKQGTIFHDSHLPLQKWFLAIALMVEARKGLSANQLKRHLRVQYKTAWYLAHRIRAAMEEGTLGKFDGVVEVDETGAGGRYDRRRKRSRYKKPGVMGLIERGGRVEALPIPARTKEVLTGVVHDRVSIDAEMVITDEYPAYRKLGKTYRHETVNHIKHQYVRGDVHTNTIENFWSLFKRGVIGSFHKSR